MATRRKVARKAATRGQKASAPAPIQVAESLKDVRDLLGDTLVEVMGGEHAAVHQRATDLGRRVIAQRLIELGALRKPQRASSATDEYLSVLSEVYFTIVMLVDTLRPLTDSDFEGIKVRIRRAKSYLTMVHEQVEMAYVNCDEIGIADLANDVMWLDDPIEDFIKQRKGTP